MCGGNLISATGETVGVCDSCGTRQTLPRDQTAEYDAKVRLAMSPSRWRVSESIENTRVNGESAHGAFDDELLSKAMKIAFEKGEISTSMIQRKLKLGYARAGRIIDEMEEKGYVSERQGSNPRRVLVSYDEFFQSGNNGR
jgi:S-DNA-T family DNA segregation ATPase FtsK/SpoIIIE